MVDERTHLSVGDRKRTARRLPRKTIKVIPHITDEIKAADPGRRQRKESRRFDRRDRRHGRRHRIASTFMEAIRQLSVAQ